MTSWWWSLGTAAGSSGVWILPWGSNTVGMRAMWGAFSALALTRSWRSLESRK